MAPFLIFFLRIPSILIAVQYDYRTWLSLLSLQNNDDANTYKYTNRAGGQKTFTGITFNKVLYCSDLSTNLAANLWEKLSEQGRNAVGCHTPDDEAVVGQSVWNRMGLGIATYPQELPNIGINFSYNNRVELNVDHRGILKVHDKDRKRIDRTPLVNIEYVLPNSVVRQLIYTAHVLKIEQEETTTQDIYITR